MSRRPPRPAPAPLPPSLPGPTLPPAAPARTPETVKAERDAVLYAIGTKTFQAHTLASEIAGLEARVRALNVEARQMAEALPKDTTP